MMVIGSTLDPSMSTPLTTTHGRQLPPVPLIIFLGAVVTLSVQVGFNLLRSIWLTYVSLYYLWVVGPASVCYEWPGARELVLAQFRVGSRNFRLQLSLALPSFVGILGTSMIGYHFLHLPALFGIDLDEMRQTMATYGLTPDSPGGDIGVLAWLTLLNPLMEEGFWRVFVFRMLLRPRAEAEPALHGGGFGGDAVIGDEEGGGRGRDTPGVNATPMAATAVAARPQSREEGDGSSCAPCAWVLSEWWAACIVTSGLYAAYHVPVVWNFLPGWLISLAYLGLVGLGVALQLVNERIGLIFAVGVHCAIDAVASLIIADILFQWGLA